MTAVSDHDVLRRHGYNTIKNIGNGAFGAVYLVHPCYRPQELHAIKRIQQHSSSPSVNNELEILHTLQKNVQNSKFIIALHDNFKDGNVLHLVLEYAKHGTLANFRISRTYFSEQTTRVFAMQIILGIEYIHHHRIMHRDIKPENVLIASNGYIKLADFGLAKDLPNNCRTYTQCGTSMYTAPEMIYGNGYGMEIDWWGMGVMIYEMLCGSTPFKNQDGILKSKCKYPTGFSKRVIIVIKKFLKKNPSKRIGHCQSHSDEIREQEWFHDDPQYDWKRIAQQEVNLPKEIKDLII